MSEQDVAVLNEETVEMEDANLEEPAGNTQQEPEGTTPKEPEEYTLQYNHETIKVPKEEATRLFQLGKYIDGKEDLIKTADELFKQSGCKDYREWAESIREKERKAAVDQLIVDRGLSEEDARELVRLRQIEKNFQEQDRRKNEEERIAEQMRELKNKYPDVDLNALPKEVAEFAAKNKVPVAVAYENAYLLPKLMQELSAKKKAEENAGASVGSVKTDKVNDTFADEFERQWKMGQI